MMVMAVVRRMVQIRNFYGSLLRVDDEHESQNDEQHDHEEHRFRFLPRHPGTLPGTAAGFKVELYRGHGGI